MIPGLATEWKVDDADKTLWTFKLRPGVKFHDGSAFDADAVIWNSRRSSTGCAAIRHTASRRRCEAAPAGPFELPQDRRHGDRDQDQVGRLALPVSAPVVPGLEPGADGRSSARIGTSLPWSRRAPACSSSPASCRASSAELVKNEAYWNPKRIPMVDRFVLICAPEDSSRSAALISGAVDMIDGPAPDVVGSAEEERGAHLDQHHAARVPVSSLAGRGIAVDRHQGAQGGRSRDRPRCHREAAARAGDAGLWRGRQEQRRGSASPPSRSNTRPTRRES